MADPSDSFALPPPSIASSPNNSPTKLSPSATLDSSPTPASFPSNRSTKLSLSVVIPPSEFTSFSRSSPAKSSPSAVQPPSPITASSPSSCSSIRMKLSPNDALPLSTSCPTKLSPITVHPPSPNILFLTNSETNLSPSAALSPSSASSRSSATKSSPIATLPPSSTSPTLLSVLVPSSPSSLSSSNSTPTKLSLSPSACLPPTCSSPTEISLNPTLPPPGTSPTEISLNPTLPPPGTSPTEISLNPTPPPPGTSPTEISLNPTLPPPEISLNPTLPPPGTSPTEISLNPTLPPPGTSPTEISPSSSPKVQQIAALIPPSNTGPKSPPCSALPPSPKLSPSAASSSSSGLTINVSDLECCIDDVMSALGDKGQKCRLVESGNKLKDTAQHVSSDFSKVFGSIAEGTRIISDQRSCSTKVYSQGHSVTSEIIKEVANIHWAAIGLLTIANVLERFDKISINDRDCFDLLKVMLDLAKVLKQLKDNSFDRHKEIAEKMVEALSLIWGGAKLCRSFIAHKKFLKFFFTTKIRDDLVYIRRRMDGMIVQLSLQIQIKDASFNNSQRQPYSDSPGSHPMFEPTGFPCDQSTTTNEILQWGLPSEQSTTTNENLHSGGLSCEQITTTNEILRCEMGDAAQAELCPADSHIEICAAAPNVISQVDAVGESDEPVSCKIERPQKSRRRFFRLPAYIRKLKQGRCSPTQRKEIPGKKVVLGVSLDKRDMTSFSIEGESGGIPTIHFTPEELDSATCSFQHQLTSSHARFNMFKGSLPSGRQVQVRRFPSQEASSSEQDNMKIMLDELGCMLHLRHKNVVKLVGLSNIEKEEPMLVYDYPPHGRLSDFLLGDSTGDKKKGDSKKKKVLVWSERSKILMGVISALVYLHEAADEHMYWVHGDIKPENILLDGNFNAKLSDFSLAKVLAFDDSSSGYEVDIYSFGVLVLQIVSGRDPLPTTYDGDVVDLRTRAWRLYKEDRLYELIDPQLLEREGCEFTSIIRSIKIALWCVVTDPSQRPKTSQLSAMLSTEEEIPSLPDDSILIDPHSNVCHQFNGSDESVRSVESGQSEVGIEEVEEPRA